MTWEQLVVAMLVFMALLVQLLRALKGTVEEEQSDEIESKNIPVATKSGIPSRAWRGPVAAPPSDRRIEAFPAGRHRRARLRLSSIREARRGIVLMAVLGPCRGLERSTPPGE